MEAQADEIKALRKQNAELVVMVQEALGLKTVSAGKSSRVGVAGELGATTTVSTMHMLLKIERGKSLTLMTHMYIC